MDQLLVERQKSGSEVMNWNEGEDKAEPAVGWHWYRERPLIEPFPLKVLNVCRFKYIWPLGNDPNHPPYAPSQALQGRILGALHHTPA